MAASTASAATASNGPAVTGKASCPKGYVCVWDNTSWSGKPKWKSQGDLERNMYSPRGVSIVNNGVASPGADHIHYKYVWPHGSYGVGCVHYPPDDNSTAIGEEGTLVYARWGGEC
ncbi:peptidase inhibitor family I36 protein [Streptomyces sp. HNM0574]|uniref:peptidase inhibitor family I36 protein n=1 Tax=Streptomyces sp. HNM0574 TaxID=2714954 RepID=UPI00146B7618|nr:peptidase inhibitor family I36 protein [Streptomyces sp. HNM0574]NLU68248.1 hypothetical protein [Streptomyces sp. HNM0574]